VRDWVIDQLVPLDLLHAADLLGLDGTSPHQLSEEFIGDAAASCIPLEG
jgi:hypothetical protein